MFDANYRYDVILGNDFINKVGIDTKETNIIVECLGNKVPMRTLPAPAQAEEDFNALGLAEV